MTYRFKDWQNVFAMARGDGDEDSTSGDMLGSMIEVDDAPPVLPEVLPVLPIREMVVFPGAVMPLGVGRPASRRLLDDSLPESKIIALVTQRDESVEEPGPGDLFRVGVAATVLKLMRQPDETVSILIQGFTRIAIQEFTQTEPFLKARVARIQEQKGKGQRFDAAVGQLRAQARELIELTPNASEQALTILVNIEEPGHVADFLAANLNIEVQQKQDLLEEFDVAKRVRAVHFQVSSQLEITRLQQKIQQDVQTSIGDSQRRIFLREQMKAIQKELGEDGDGAGEVVEQLRTRIEEAQPPEKVLEEANRDLDRLALIPPASPEYSLIMTYLELIADLPWAISSDDNHDLVRAQEVLDRDHYDLAKVKRRLIEFLAVRKLNPEGRGPILCLVGPPGVGKTSLGRSIADALGRKFARLSLGGIRDESEVRGHRRTYVGAMPGRIIQEIRRAGANNPVMMLDEVDKLGADFRGDPSSALLEVLDPRQNNAFVDRYLDVPFDLSKVIFIATANYIGNVPPALRDRMEIIEITGYTDHEKAQIASRYIVPRQMEENGLKARHCRWRVAGLRKVIDDYTREAGVRELERQIGSVCRAIAANVARTEVGHKGTVKPGGKRKSKAKKSRKPVAKPIAVTADVVREHLGPEKFVRELDTRTGTPGVVVGLAYTPVGGEILFVEAAIYAGKGSVKLTGQIGDVMKESMSAALSLFKSRAHHFHIDIARLNRSDLHIHVPAGAVPKDGPSAGVSMYVAIASLLLDLPVKPKLAMTGEISLRGLVMPIGGLKEKALAAARAGIKTILIPKQNERDLEEVDDEVKAKTTFIPVENVDELLDHALGKAAIDTVVKRLEKQAAARADAASDGADTADESPAN